MTLQILKIIEETDDGVLVAEPIPHAYFDGYDIADRQLEGVPIKVSIKDGALSTEMMLEDELIEQMNLNVDAITRKALAYLRPDGGCDILSTRPEGDDDTAFLFDEEAPETCQLVLAPGFAVRAADGSGGKTETHSAQPATAKKAAPRPVSATSPEDLFAQLAGHRPQGHGKTERQAPARPSSMEEFMSSLNEDEMDQTIIAYRDCLGAGQDPFSHPVIHDMTRRAHYALGGIPISHALIDAFVISMLLARYTELTELSA